MSKTFKRIFAAALVLCMILAVLPATASAADATNSTIYNFSWYDTSAEGYTANKGMQANLAYSYADRETKPNNWYLLKAHTDSDTFLTSTGIGTNQGFNGTWGYVKYFTLLLDVPNSGWYDIGAVHAIQNKPGRLKLSFTKVTSDADITSAAGGSNVRNDTTFDTILDTNVRNGTVSTENCLAILGNKYLEQGQYILYVSPADCISKTEFKDCRATFKSVVLTPSEQAGKMIDYAVNNAVTSGIISVQTASWDASKGDVALDRREGFVGITTIDLFGNEAKFNTLSSRTGITVQDSKGNGALTLASGLAPVLESNYQYQLPLSADGASYKLADATVAMAPTIQEAKDAEGNAVDADGAFVFAINMADAAYDYGNEGVVVTMVINDTTAEEKYTVRFVADQMEGTALNEWSKDAKYFYANVKGLDVVAGHTLQVTAYISCGGASVSATQTYVIPAA